jgi:hypothetical protein
MKYRSFMKSAVRPLTWPSVEIEVSFLYHKKILQVAAKLALSSVPPDMVSRSIEDCLRLSGFRSTHPSILLRASRDKDPRGEFKQLCERIIAESKLCPRERPTGFSRGPEAKYLQADLSYFARLMTLNWAYRSKYMS